MNGVGFDPGSRQVLGHLVGTMLGAGEHKHLREGGIFE